ncbi:DUF6414 family protein [Pontibacter populi]|uniref:Uncharacterized protein n=1 Tax=Pontibacter populi TaxID=890055 RepID=A0ABV1RP50_9BACT
MTKLRSFIYLDNYKMYSFSSQLFEGLTEYIVQSKSDKSIEEEQQKGKLGSGRILADIIEKDISQTEKKFLHDYSYNLFEETLVNSGRVLELNQGNVNSEIENIHNYSFVKITGRVVFNDSKSVQHTIENFNEIGEALTYISNRGAIEEMKSTLSEQAKGIKDRNAKAKANALIRNALDVKKMAKEQSLYFDPEFLKKLSYILEYGFNQQFEAQIPFEHDDAFQLFTAQLIRENLKESEFNIIKKYSRETEKEFKLFGIPTQVQGSGRKGSILDKIREIYEDTETESSMKEYLMYMASLLSNVERTFSGKLDFEYVIDPIALYIEI